MILNVKTDLRRKARLVAGGHKVNADGHSSYSSVVRLDSIRLLNVIAKAQGLGVLVGDVGNAYLNADTKEKVYFRCGPEFGPELEGRIAIIKKGLYGLNVDDFLITVKDPWVYIKQLQDIYKIKDPKVPDSYLGAMYTGHPGGK